MGTNFLKSWLNGANFAHWLKKSYILIILVIIYVPLILIVFLSFTDPSSRNNVVLTFATNWNHGENYHKLFFDPTYYGNFLTGLLNSVVIGVIVTPIALIIGVLATFGIWKSKQLARNYVLNTAKISIVNPDVITGIALSTLFVSAFLPLGISLGWLTIILAQISFSVPYVIITIYPIMMKLNYNLILASYDLNQKQWATFFKVVIPYLLPIIFVAALITFATSFDDFIITNLVKGRVTTLSTELYTMRKGIKSWAISFGGLLVLITIFVVVLLSIFKVTKKSKFATNSWTKVKYLLDYLRKDKARSQNKPLDPDAIISLTE